jgi:uncharacterized protein YbjT (DUF2867 family)
MIAVVAGATGLTGRALIEELEKDPRITRIRAWVRGVGRLPDTPKLEQVEWSEGLEGKSGPGDLYFCCIGTTIKKAGSRQAFRKADFDAVVEFGRLCDRQKGRALVLVSAIGADSRSRIFYSRVKAEAEQAVNELSIPRVVVVRPSLLIGDRKETRPAERASIVLWRAVQSWMPEGLRLRAGTRIEDLARVMVQQALLPESGRSVIEADEIC